MTKKITPNYAQEQAILKVEKAIQNGNNKSLIVVPSGVGKTVLSIFLTKKIQGKILYIAHRIEILDQAKKEFGRPPTMLEAHISHPQIQKYYGSYIIFKEKLGDKDNLPNQRDIIEKYKRMTRTLGKKPTRPELGISDRRIRKLFGSYRKFQKIADKEYPIKQRDNKVNNLLKSKILHVRM